MGKQVDNLKSFFYNQTNNKKLKSMKWLLETEAATLRGSSRKYIINIRD